MKIHRVTFTGADDTVEIEALRDFAEEFGFVEFGILFSKKRQGNEPRYPTHGWLNQLRSTGGKSMRLAAHLCGSLARDVVAGDDGWFEIWEGVFDRAQINGVPVRGNQEQFVELALHSFGTEFILQCTDRTSLDDVVSLDEIEIVPADEKVTNISALYDASGGRGLTATWWPTPTASLRLGYAGGIGPDNIDDVLDQLASIDGPPTWIDMESRVRSSNGAQFDLSLCRKVARAVAKRRWPG